MANPSSGPLKPSGVKGGNSNAEESATITCSECGSKHMRRRSVKLIDKITSFYPYACGDCGNRERKFRLRLGSLLAEIMVLAVVAVGILLWRHPPGLLLSGAVSPDAVAEPSAQQKSQSEALARARNTAGGELSTFEQMMLKKPKSALTNATVLKLVKANMGKEVIIQMIRTSTPDYDLSANAVIELKDAGTDPAIILAMIDASNAPR